MRKVIATYKYWCFVVLGLLDVIVENFRCRFWSSRSVCILQPIIMFTLDLHRTHCKLYC